MRKSHHPDMHALIEYLIDSIEELAPILEEIAKGQLWEDGKQPDGREILTNSLFALGIQLAVADGDFSESEASFLQALQKELNVVADHDLISYSPAMMRDIYLAVMNSNPNEFAHLRAPVTLGPLKVIDLARGTEYASKAATMYFRFANALLKADGTVTPKETTILSNLQKSMSQNAILPSVQKESIAAPLNTPAQATPRVAEDVDLLLNELHSLVGLDEIKSDIENLVNYLKVQDMRKGLGMEALPAYRHLVFYGNPGTGKTTVARLLSRIYQALGILERGHLVETDRSGLVAGYVGQTALKVKEVVSQSLGGVLFVDEAYSLAGEGQDYGGEAIDALIKLMEDNRNELVVIVAGYTDKMRGFVNSNPGLRSRFNKYFNFKDYTPSELLLIFEGMAKRSGFTITPEASQRVASVLESQHRSRDASFGNGRLVRNVFEETIGRQANRIVNLPAVDKLILSTIEAEDIPQAAGSHSLSHELKASASNEDRQSHVAQPQASDRIRFNCPQCGKRLKVEGQYAGKKGRCIHCGESIQVPLLQ